MKQFMDQDFLLTTETAKELYHQCAATMPVLDYHCHIDPKEISENRRFENITQLWLGGDHYKWRQMRWAGVDEQYITGDAPDREKFQKWAEVLPLLIGNPLYHWSHLELQRYFNFHGTLNGETAQEVWDKSQRILQTTRVRDFIRQSGVTLICTTDDPADTLEWHKSLRADSSFEVKVLPAWRPEAAMQIDSPGFAAYLEKLGKAAGVQVTSFASLRQALDTRMDFFQRMGCCTADHSLDYVMYCPGGEAEIERIFQKGLSGGSITRDEKLKYLTAFMLYAGQAYQKRNWVMQIHFGVYRNGNTKMFRRLGANVGFDNISNYTPADQMVQFLDALCVQDQLPKTILYSLNPGDNTTIATVLGNYQSGQVPGKMQLGSGWWFFDTKAGMQAQMTELANQGALSTFVGMLTDSRSFISYPRHEYFRRILCELLGSWVENGEYPYDRDTLFSIVRGICYNNAVRYFGFDV